MPRGPMSAETRRKIGEAQKRSWASPNRKKRTMKGSKVSKETRRKMSEAMKLRWQDPEMRKKMLSNRDYSASAKSLQTSEANKKRSEAVKKYWSDPKNRKKASIRMKIRMEDITMKRKVAESARKRMEELKNSNPDYFKRLGRYKSIPVVVRIETGRLKRFESGSAAADHFNVSRATISNWIRSGKNDARYAAK